MPKEKEINDYFSRLIKYLSEEYSTPCFEPHISLMGKDIFSDKIPERKMKQLASFIKPFKIKVCGVGYLENFTKCLFLKVKETPELLDASRKARDIFNIPAHAHMFHLSLVYGKFPPEIKEKIIEENELGNISKEFTVDKLYLYEIHATAPDWSCAGEFSFS